MKLKFFFSLIAVCILSLTGFAQKGFKPGYIITNDFDTIRGAIAIKKNSQYSKACEFIGETEQEPRTCSPGDILAFRIENSKYYISKDVDLDSSRQKLFLEFLVDGIVDLYYLKTPINEYYFIEKNGELTPLTNELTTVVITKDPNSVDFGEKRYSKNSNKYKGMLRYLFQDSPEVMTKIESTSFDYKPLIKITTDYHNSVCKDYSCIDFSRSTSQGIYIEPYLGIVNSWLGLTTSSDHDYNLKPAVGLNLRVNPLKGFSNWNFLLGISYSMNDFYGEFECTLFTPELKSYILAFKYSAIRLPVTAEYTIPFKKLQPYFSFSYVNVFQLHDGSAVLRADNGEPFPGEQKMQVYNSGIAGGIGLRYRMNNNRYFFINSQYEFRKPADNHNYVADYSKVSSLIINFGYGFKIK